MNHSQSGDCTIPSAIHSLLRGNQFCITAGEQKVKALEQIKENDIPKQVKPFFYSSEFKHMQGDFCKTRLPCWRQR